MDYGSVEQSNTDTEAGNGTKVGDSGWEDGTKRGAADGGASTRVGVARKDLDVPAANVSTAATCTASNRGSGVNGGSKDSGGTSSKVDGIREAVAVVGGGERRKSCPSPLLQHHGWGTVEREEEEGGLPLPSPKKKAKTLPVMLGERVFTIFAGLFEGFRLHDLYLPERGGVLVCTEV